jgi:hypothetical protein
MREVGPRREEPALLLAVIAFYALAHHAPPTSRNSLADFGIQQRKKPAFIYLRIDLYFACATYYSSREILEVLHTIFAL